MGRNLNKILWAFLALTVISCDDNRLFDEYKLIENGWHKDSIITFGFKEPEPAQPTNLFINVVANNDYKYNNLYLIVGLEDPTGFTKVDTLEYGMAHPDGKLMGEGFSDVKQNKLWYKENISFPKKGLYKVHIQHAMREQGKVKGVEKLEGISKIGFRMEALSTTNSK